MIMRRLLFSTGNVVFSLILGAIAFGYVFLKYPDQMAQILDWAGGFKSYQLTAIVVNAVLKALIGRGLSFAATGTMMRTMATAMKASSAAP